MADCNNTSVGLPPIPEFDFSYLGVAPGRLYPGSNNIPAAHAAEGATRAAAVRKLDSNGDPAPAGKIVVLSIGMSNTSDEFTEFMRVADSRAGHVVLVNGAQASRDAEYIAENAEDYFTVVGERLTAKNVNANQVQVVWLKQAVANPATDDFPDHAETLQGYLKTIVLEIADRYPNCQMVFLSSRTYGGYSTAGNAEPESFETGFSVKWLIESQIDGSDTDLAYASVPWLAWATYVDTGIVRGAYLWADGTTANDAGLVWNCDDFESDGKHPAGTEDGVDAPDGAEHKVAALLLEFFENSPYTVNWWYGFEPTLHATMSKNTASSFTFDDSYTPTADTWQAFAVFSRPGSAVTPNQPTVTGHGLTYEAAETRVFSTEATPRARLTVFRAAGASPTAGAPVVDFAGQEQSVCLAIALEIAGVYTGGTAGSGGVVQSESNSANNTTSLSVSLAAQTITPSMILAFFAKPVNSNFVERAGWTEVTEINNTTTLARLQAQFINEYDAPASVTQVASANTGGVALELRGPPASQLVEPEAIATGESFGTAVVSGGVVLIRPESIATGVSFGTATITTTHTKYSRQSFGVARREKNYLVA